MLDTNVFDITKGRFMQDQWAAVDAYIEDKLLPQDVALEEALAASRAAGLPEIQVAPNQGRLIAMLATIQGASRILEIGTLGGYSTIWLARALSEGGQLISLEREPLHVRVARENIARAGLADRVEIREGKAVDTLDAMIAGGEAPFDYIFIDADKPSTAAYLERSLALSRPGTLILVDNVVRNGAVADPGSTDANVIGVQAVFDQLASSPALTATAIQTVGGKGYDGFALLLVS
jgi:predicted O-methyltransferase YrrM